MISSEWDVPHTITTDDFEINFNTVDVISPGLGIALLIVPSGYQISPALRTTKTDLSQHDGSFLHDRFKTGVMATFSFMPVLVHGEELPADYEPLCGAPLRRTIETIAACLDQLRSPHVGVQTLSWLPTFDGEETVDRRMITDIRVAEWLPPTFEGDNPPQPVYKIVLESPFPYAVGLTPLGTQTISTVGGVEHGGNAFVFPVIRVQGPFSGFTLSNNSIVDDNDAPLSIVYDAARPGGASVGGGSYAEIDTFRGTIFLNGDGADLTAGLDPTQTDFFPIAPNVSNSITTDGADADFDLNDGWT